MPPDNFPYFIHTKGEPTDCISDYWTAQRNVIDELLLTYGAILLRGMQVDTLQKFNGFMSEFKSMTRGITK